jgi:hypothetical protein
VIEEQNSHEPHPQEDIEALFDHPFQIVEETKESWTTFDGEQPLEIEIKEFLMHLSSDLVCIQEPNHPKIEDIHGTIEEDIQSGPNEQVNQ